MAYTLHKASWQLVHQEVHLGYGRTGLLIGYESSWTKRKVLKGPNNNDF